MHLIFYGPEGSGKGTQAKLLSDKLNLAVYTSGDLVRKAAMEENRTSIGDAARVALNEGKYVPDEIMYKLWGSKLASNEAKQGFILDGFPRNVNQAKFIKEQILRSGYGIDRFIFLSLGEEESVRRLTLRHRKLFEGSSVNHDDPERIRKRLVTYKSLENEIVGFYRREGLLLEVDAMGTREEVFQKILKGLNL